MPRSRLVPAALSIAVLLVAWAAASYVWVEPLFRERARRGDYLWGHYHPLDVYVGVPLAVVTLCLTAIVAVLWLLPPPRRARSAFRIGALAFSTLFAVLVFDLAYSLGYLGAWRSDYWLDLGHISRVDNVPDVELGFRRRPGATWYGKVRGTDRVVHYETDEQGFRNPRGVGRADIVFIGDSYTEAAQVEDGDTFVRRVAAAAGLSAVNLGRGAYGPQQELVVLRRFGLAYRPRFVVWQLFDGNDLSDAQQFAAWQDDPTRPGSPLLERYLENSFFKRWLDETYRSKKGEFATLRLGDGTAKALSIRYRWQPDQVDERGRGFEATERAIRAGLELCRANGIELVLLFIPTMARVNAPRLEFADAADREHFCPAESEPGPAGARDFGSRLASYCAEIGCPLIDAFPMLRSRAETDPAGIYIPSDEHLDLGGHELMAELLLEWLDQHR